MYSNTFNTTNPKAAELFERSRDAGFPPGTGGFEIVRKGEAELLADRRIVWDNDKQPKELAGQVPSRWYAPAADATAWNADNANQPKIFAHKPEVPGQHWIRYRHLAMPWKTTAANQFDDAPPTDPRLLGNQLPTYIDNFLGYNAGRDQDPITGRVATRDNTGQDKHWVGDLILECEAELGGDAELTLELSKGVNRYRATFAAGAVTLARTGRGGEQFGNPSRPCKVAQGKYRLRFANVDGRLWVWVDDKLIDFGTEGNYQPVEPGPNDGADPEGWTKANDVDAPAGIGAAGKVTVSGIRLYRDIFYTRRGTDPTRADIYYVQPGHYLCLGDNSAQSSDSRNWGTVPERLMLGKAVFVFFPVGRIGFIK
jgi:signal peptidase I